MPFLKRRINQWVLLLVCALAIRLSAIRQDWVENYYSTGIYPLISKITRYLFGWVPFSVGDIFYFFAGAWLLYRIFKGIQLLRSGHPAKTVIKSGLLWLVMICLLVYISFNFLWGLNYNRKGIAWQMNLEVKDTATTSLVSMTALLRDHTNDWKPAESSKKPFSSVRVTSMSAYQQLQQSVSWLAYHPESVKPSLYGVLGNYMGYSGYYNPFSGEAQLNTHIPGFLVPFSTCHEIAHQLGYAKENEANFVGYLAARESADSAMRYSAYLNMFLYANNELRYMDSTLAKENFEKLSVPVKKDLAEYRQFLIIYEGPVEKFVDVFYHQFLKLNEQPAGRRTYNKVVLWLLAYYQQRGTI